MKYQHTVGHVDCPACEALSCEALDPQSLADLNLPKASELYRRERAIFIQQRTRDDYDEYFAKLIEFFGDRLKLNQFTIGNVRAYQRWRSETAGPLRTNAEVGAFARLMKEASLWQRIKPYYKRLPVPHEGPGRALSPEEAIHLFRVGAKNTRWKIALYTGLISAHTGVGPGEIQHLQLADIDLESRHILIRRGVKNRFRVRKADLNHSALAATRRLLERARDHGCCEPTHYLLPARNKTGGGFDPTKFQTNWRKSWEGMCKAAGLEGLRPYDMRHTFATWALSNPNTPIEVLIEMMGWVNPQMIKRYSHQRAEAKRQVVDALEQIDLFAPEKKKPGPTNLLDGIDVRTKVQ